MGSKKTEDLQWLPRGWASQHMGKGGGRDQGKNYGFYTIV